MLPFREVLLGCDKLSHLRQGVIWLGPKCEKVETLPDQKGDHPPYGSSALAVSSVINQVAAISSFPVDGFSLAI